jgi:hypothetical protein
MRTELLSVTRVALAREGLWKKVLLSRVFANNGKPGQSTFETASSRRRSSAVTRFSAANAR